jgi:hypothetical protein
MKQFLTCYEEQWTGLNEGDETFLATAMFVDATTAEEAVKKRAIYENCGEDEISEISDGGFSVGDAIVIHVYPIDEIPNL